MMIVAGQLFGILFALLLALGAWAGWSSKPQGCPARPEIAAPGHERPASGAQVAYSGPRAHKR